MPVNHRQRLTITNWTAPRQRIHSTIAVRQRQIVLLRRPVHQRWVSPQRLLIARRRKWRIPTVSRYSESPAILLFRFFISHRTKYCHLFYYVKICFCFLVFVTVTMGNIFPRNSVTKWQPGFFVWQIIALVLTCPASRAESVLMKRCIFFSCSKKYVERSSDG